MKLMELSPKQQEIAQTIIDWYTSSSRAPFITLGGYAGTGKTTLIGYIARALREKDPKIKIAFCSYTGKATRVLETKLREQQVATNADSISTIHRLIYEPVMGNDNEIVGWQRRTEDFPYKLIIVDEASMLNLPIWQDLLGYQLPILAVGDHGQLPPIEGDFNLMERPQLRLEEIFRQEAQSPIIKLSQLAREQGHIPFGIYGHGVKKLNRAEPETQEFLAEILARRREDMLVLTGYNHTRVKINKAIRGLHEFETGFPEKGDKVICLKNNHKLHIYNGMVGEVKNAKYMSWDDYVFATSKNPKQEAINDEVKEHLETPFFAKIEGADPIIQLEVEFPGDDRRYQGYVVTNQFNQLTTAKQVPRTIDLFDFGYALTVHKAQGSQARVAVVFEERFAKMTDDQWRRWLYTAVTRAAEELYIVA